MFCSAVLNEQHFVFNEVGLSEMVKIVTNQRFWVVGTARDISHALTSSVRHLRNVFSTLGETTFFVVESNSSDNTVGVLERLSSEVSNFSFDSIDGLPDGSKLRTHRLARCRNHYLDYLLKQQLGDNDLVVVADLDGVNGRLSGEVVATSLREKTWDVITANQAGRYYDLWALRHPIWCPSDYRSYSEFLVAQGYSNRAAHRLSVRARQIRIAPESGLIEVESAFGGLAIYRPWVVGTSRYEGTTPDGFPVSEHVPFHHGARAAGARIFINPRMINAHRTEHTSLFSLFAAHTRKHWRHVLSR